MYPAILCESGKFHPAVGLSLLSMSSGIHLPDQKARLRHSLAFHNMQFEIDRCEKCSCKTVMECPSVIVAAHSPFSSSFFFLLVRLLWCERNFGASFIETTKRALRCAMTPADSGKKRI